MEFCKFGHLLEGDCRAIDWRFVSVQTQIDVDCYNVTCIYIRPYNIISRDGCLNVKMLPCHHKDSHYKDKIDGLVLTPGLGATNAILG